MGCNSCRPFVWGGIGINGGCGCGCNSCNSCNVCGDSDRDECTSCCG